MNTASTLCGHSPKDFLKQQLIASIAGGNAMVAEELKLLLKLHTPETLRGLRPR